MNKKQKFLIVNQKSFSDFGVETQKDLWIKAKSEGYSGLQTEAKAEFTKSEKEDGKYHAILSSANMDRQLDIVFQNFDLKNFAKNPVLLDSHNYDSITRIAGKLEDTRVENAMLQSNVIFAIGTELGKLAQYLVDNKFLNALSVGFIPLEFDQNGNITKSELLEVSLCAVPANADALFQRDIKEKKEVEKKEVIVEKVEVNKVSEINKAIIKMGRENQELLCKIADNFAEMRPSNKQEKQRKIFKTIRNAFK